MQVSKLKNRVQVSTRSVNSAIAVTMLTITAVSNQYFQVKQH